MNMNYILKLCTLGTLVLMVPAQGMSKKVKSETKEIFSALNHAYCRTVIAHLTLYKNKPSVLNGKDRFGNTPLILAAYHARNKTIDFMLSYTCVDLNIQNYEGYTALMFAVYNGHTQIVKSLLKCSNIDVNLKTTTGKTALSIAVWRGYTEIVKELLSHPKINLNIKDGGQTPYEIAKEYNHIAILNALKNH